VRNTSAAPDRGIIEVQRRTRYIGQTSTHDHLGKTENHSFSLMGPLRSSLRLAKPSGHDWPQKPFSVNQVFAQPTGLYPQFSDSGKIFWKIPEISSDARFNVAFNCVARDRVLTTWFRRTQIPREFPLRVPKKDARVSISVDTHFSQRIWVTADQFFYRWHWHAIFRK